MNYRYTSKKYKATKTVKVGDLVEFLHDTNNLPEVTFTFPSTRIRGYIRDAMTSPVELGGDYYSDLVTVSVPNFGNVSVRIKSIKLIEQTPITQSVMLEAWLKSGKRFRTSTMDAIKYPGDNAIILINTSPYKILAIIDRRSVKLNMGATYNIRRVLERFATRQHLRVIKLPKSMISPKSKPQKASPFWRLDKDGSSADPAMEWNNRKIKRSRDYEYIPTSPSIYQAATRSDSIRFYQDVEMTSSALTGLGLGRG